MAAIGGCCASNPVSEGCPDILAKCGAGTSDAAVKQICAAYGASVDKAVRPTWCPHEDAEKKRLSTAAIAGISAGAVVVILLATVAVIYVCIRRSPKEQYDPYEKYIDAQ
jgi:hypothetical protein